MVAGVLPSIGERKGGASGRLRAGGSSVFWAPLPAGEGDSEAMDHRGPRGAEFAGTLALFPSDVGRARTRVLDARAVEAGDFDLDAFARYRHIRILTYSRSVISPPLASQRTAAPFAICEAWP